MSNAFEPVQVGRYRASTAIVMAPMTRSRAYGEGGSPTDLMATYYGQRAGAGLIVTEGIQPSAVGQGYMNTPGLHTAAQVAAWQKVTGAVHERGGLIFAQLMHTGRIGHPSLYAGDTDLSPVGASPVRAAGQAFTPDGPQDHVVPRELASDEIHATVEEFAEAARNAIAAGFDGVEIHGANGYLLHQFLSTNANVRTDEWGGDNRIRLVVEVARAVAGAIGADRTGLRLSPANGLGDLVEDGHRERYLALLDELNPLGLAYLHVMEGPDTEFTPQLRERWTGTLILNPYTPGAWTGPEALQLVETGAADLVSYGALFLANPDLVDRLRAGGPFNTPDYTKAYGGDHEGYTDYPVLA
ncbi:alkene reductase [Actinoplanes sp. RD1]|uniref:alkene reductase n=1 Tax=Actinoplanes sp. RD1 TaxID=3064538 RepID=UPI0027405915|nr:alkene reductase [Actinoplanes sp. RD1]